MKIVDRLVELVAIPSVSGNEAAITGVIEDLCHRSKPEWPLDRIGNNLVLGPIRDKKAGEPLIAFIGHTDTVPAQGNEAPKVQDGCIHGVGSCDMKGGVAVMCDLIEHLPPEPPPVNLVFIFYDKEEVGYDENGLGVVLEARPGLTEEIDFAFVLEPTALALELGCNGHLNAEVTFKGKSAHAARVWLGENAIHKAGDFISKIGAIEPREVTVGDATYREVISITRALGGIARNVVPDSFMVHVNHRFPPDRTGADAEAYVRGLCPPGVGIKIVDAAPPGAVPRANAVYEAFRAKFDLELKGKQGWTDVARLTGAGIDAVNFGPGAPELAHRRDEHVPIEQLVDCRDTLMNFVMEY